MAEKIKEFAAADNIYEDTEESEFFSAGVHFIMRLKAQYYINLALKSLKYDTSNDENLMTDWAGNIGTPGRIAKLWAWNNLDSDSLNELWDWRWVKKPRIASFELNREIFKWTFIAIDGESKVSFIRESDKKKFNIIKVPIGDRFEPGLLDIKTKRTYLIDIDNKDYNIESLLSVDDFSEFDTTKVLNKTITLAVIDNKTREIVKKEILNVWVGSTCSHHFLPYLIIGKENNSKIVIAYKAYKKNIGISKITKLVKWCSKRPSLQEGLTTLIAKELKKIVGTEDVFVWLYGLMHTCEVTRWSSTETSTTTTHAEGVFENNEY